VSDLVRAIQSRGVPYEASPSGRWVKLLTPHGEVVYLQEYAWSNDCRKHYLVFTSRNDIGSQRMVANLDEAVSLALAEWARITEQLVTR